MKKIYTPESAKKNRKEEKKVVAPSDSTLEFLKLFARTCYIEQSLPQGLKEVCVN